MKTNKKTNKVSDTLDKFWKMVDAFYVKHSKEMSKYEVNLTVKKK